MTVIKTQSWLNELVESCKKNRFSFNRFYFKQCEALCHPIKEVSAKISPEELQYILLNHGLFEPGEWKHLQGVVRKMEEKNVWKIVEQEYQRLKRKWAGPEAPIYIFPIKQAHLPAGKRPFIKSGVSFKECLFLFLAPDVPSLEIKALLAHEYNHICRFSHVDLDEKQMPLKESLIMEGLGEYAVKELYGDKQLAPWTSYYRSNKVKSIWQKHFLPSLNLKGQDNHHPFLFGKGNGQLPKWIGYQIGFEIVNSYQEQLGPLPTRELLTRTADELISGSTFSTN